MTTEEKVPGAGRKCTSARARAAALTAWEGGRRRGMDPCTTDRDYSDAEREFLVAMEAYKEVNGRRFPTWTEALEVLVSLGYRKVEPAGPLPTANRRLPGRPAGGRW